MHDGTRGMITTAMLNRRQNYLLTTGRDGILIVYQFNEEAIKMDSQFLTPGDDVVFKTEADGIEEVNFDAKV